MEDRDVVDDVNALLNLGVGDAYRLEHIKQAYIQNKSIWNADKNYLQKMVDKYLIKHSNLESDSAEIEDESENEEQIHCWKCGKKTTLGANFCMVCGASLFDVASKPKVEQEPTSPNKKNNNRTINLKIPIMIGIPVIILAIIGGAYSQGYFDNTFERTELKDEQVNVKPTIVEATEKTSSETDSPCGPGTVLDSKTNSCVLESEATEKTSSETDSPCGPGTVLDSKTNSCVLESEATEKTSSETDSPCGPGTVLDSKTNSCVLDK
ncbi:zinc-ribbon domain-containing protein [Nitrosopumilus maritimus]|uniref:Zinc-ribbon domain-containing protein n=1 Tax=Nitrosopumilus maritimus (strain SCM1) TaxID=436308 RepID=A9A5S9_NITMS|nr:zinc ribbon domain-containing protein [Nitrosopumilus maritimus]ABX13084.1 hypothetical protein Nmar_1188 [Nitrosopumilus maritimus SCM1]